MGVVIATEPDGQLREHQTRAVELGRSGELDGALDILAELRARAPGDLPLLHDETVLLSWAGRHDLVALNAMLLDPAVSPEYVSKAIAKSARDSQRFTDAVWWYSGALDANPGSIDLRLGLAMARTDTGDGIGGRRVLDGLPAEQRKQADALLVSAYIHQAEGEFIPAITDYDTVLAAEPYRTDALRGKALALRRSLLPRQALALEARHPGILTPEEISRIEADRYALALRDAAQSPDDKYSFMATNRALNEIDDRLLTEKPDSVLARSLRYDRIVGLVEAARWDKAIEYYEEMIANGDPGRPHVHLAAGSALLIRRRPEEAETALRRGEAQDPNDRLIQLELFYALVNLERMDEALAIPDDMIASLDTLQRVDDEARISQPNPVRMRSEIMADVGRAYADQLREAQHRLETLAALAPNNLDVRSQLGHVYRWRGRNDLADAAYNQVLAIDPDMLAARIGRAHNAMDLQEYRVAEAELNASGRQFVTSPGVWDFDERWVIHNYSNLIVEARWGESTGTTFGSDQFTIDGWWYSSPIKYNYRIYARTFDSWADFEDGDHDRRRAAVGGDWRDGPWRVQSEINFDRDGIDNPGFAILADYRLTDQWTLGANLELNSYATPLRADRENIESNLIGVSVGYDRNERYSASTGLYYQDFDDGNSVFGVTARSRLRLYERFTYWLDGYVNAAASSASKSDAVYFNPERSIDAVVGLDNTWRMYRFFDRALTHRLGGNVGLMNQKDFGTDGIWTIEYELNFDVNKQLSFHFGVELSRRVYDGNSEDGTFWLAGLNGWF
jgi:biofilm PGA synthesis protein PgaA